MRILVVGDAMVDRYWIGAQTRENPEGAHRLVDVERVVDVEGGAANVAANLHNLGADVVLVSGIGRIIKNRVMVPTGTAIRFDEGSKLRGIPAKRLVGARKKKIDAVVVSDYGKGSVTDDVAVLIGKWGLPTFVDCKVSPVRWVGFATAAFPNQEEYERHASTYKFFEAIVAKRGRLGADYRDNFGNTTTWPSLATEVKNVAGAGDTVMAAFAIAWLSLPRRDDKPSLCLEFAMQAAAVAVSRPTTSAPTLDEVVEAFPKPGAGTMLAAMLRNEGRLTANA